MTADLDIEALDRAVESALESGDPSTLDVIGTGEISPVVRWPGPDGSYACKRLPIFDDEDRFDAFRRCFLAYVDQLEERGTQVVDSRLEAVHRKDGRVVAYCTQPVLDARTLAPTLLQDADDESGAQLLEAIVERVAATVDDRLGLDAQLSNWALDGDRFTYLDVTTPLMRDERGHEQLDTDLFLAALPWALRGVVRRFLLGGILDGYFRPRGVVLDLAGNLHKERLVRWVPTLLRSANARLDLDLTTEDVARYYRRDARTWEALLRLRRVDRLWQRKVRRRTYPFLIPEGIER